MENERSHHELSRESLPASDGKPAAFFGAVLGDSGYVRDRDAEFAAKGKTRADLLADIDAALASVKDTLAKLTGEDFAKTYPIEVFGQPMTTGYFLTHLATHFNYHLGQINYHRRLLARA